MRSREFRLPTPLYREVSPVIERELGTFRSALKSIDRAVRKDPAALLAACSSARSAVDTLMDLFDRLRLEEEGFPRYSESPFLHQLAYFTHGYLSRQLSERPLRDFLGFLAQRHREMSRDLAEWGKASAENPRVEELTPALARSLRHLGRGLAEMSRSLSAGDRARLEKYLKAVLEVGEEMVRLHKELNEALAPTVACPRCGVGNEPGSRVCSGCGARLPELASGPVSSLEVFAGQRPTRPRFAHVTRLEEAVEQHLAGSLSRDELAETLRWFASRVAAGRKSLSALRPPDRFPSPEMEQTAARARALMEEGGATMEAGAALLERYLTDGSRDQAERGLEQVRAGSELVGEAQKLLRP